MLQDFEKEISASPDGSIEKDSFNILLDTMAPATTQTYFGLDMTRASPHVGRDIEQFFNEAF